MFKSIRVAASRSPMSVLGVFAGSTSLPRGMSELDTAHDKALSAALKTPGFRGDLGECLRAGDNAVLIGLGERDRLTPNALRTLGGKLLKCLDRMAPKSVELHVASVIPRSVATPQVIGRCLAEGMGLANWRVDFFSGSASRIEAAHAQLSVSASDAECRAGLKEGLQLAESTNIARRLAATPPNICSPAYVASEARKLAKSLGMTCSVISYQQAKKLGMGGLVNVGMASANKPCLVRLEHKPRTIASSAKGRKIVLVGKTITYDTGGYSLKISGGMKGMKYDKNGGMAVLGAMHAIASLKLPVHVIAYLPAAENMVAGDAYRPDDIITMYNGVTVEVTNTDAEGRLVLADALAYACKHDQPTTILDLATLTGGVVVALGSWCAGVFANNDGVMNELQRAADGSGERIWRLPLWDDHREFMRAKHADIWNSGPKRDGHPIQGAAFLDYFVDRDIPWAHIDIAGMSAVDADTDLYVQGPTGFGVRLVTEYIRRLAE